jgi:hypothetical protein
MQKGKGFSAWIFTVHLQPDLADWTIYFGRERKFILYCVTFLKFLPSLTPFSGTHKVHDCK